MEDFPKGVPTAVEKPTVTAVEYRARQQEREQLVDAAHQAFLRELKRVDFRHPYAEHGQIQFMGESRQLLTVAHEKYITAFKAFLGSLHEDDTLGTATDVLFRQGTYWCDNYGTEYEDLISPWIIEYQQLATQNERERTNEGSS